MALKAHLETAHPRGASVEARRTQRRALFLEASGILPGGFEANVLIHNVSPAGLLLETDAPLDVDEKLMLDLPEAGAVRAVIVWQSGALFGCAFEQALDSRALAAMQLRSADPAVRVGTPLEAPPEPLGAKLNRLRRERGLTLAQVAEVLGVSKPTVWAWEKGKARPLPDRIEPIALVLGVPAAELEERMGEDRNAALVEDCRLRIATAYGTHPPKVRIMIEV